MITLEPVSEKTFKKVVDMKLEGEQSRYVAPNVVSLAQAWLYYEDARPLAVLNDSEVVGFMMLDWDEGERSVGIWRFMIATEYQHRGFGRMALEAAIDYIRAAGKFDIIYLDYVEDNKRARELYHSLGFRENGDVEEGEIVMTLPLTDSPKLGMLTADGDDAEDFAELVEAEQRAGSPVLPVMRERDELMRLIERGEVRRFTVMGKTAGLAVGGELLMKGEYAEFCAEAEKRLKEI